MYSRDLRVSFIYKIDIQNVFTLIIIIPISRDVVAAQRQVLKKIIIILKSTYIIWIKIKKKTHWPMATVKWLVVEDGLKVITEHWSLDTNNFKMVMLLFEDTFHLETLKIFWHQLYLSRYVSVSWSVRTPVRPPRAWYLFWITLYMRSWTRLLLALVTCER